MAAYGGPVPIGAKNNTAQPTTGYGIKPAKPKVDWAALAANPKTRAKVPDAILKKVNPTAYTQRQTNQYNKAPITNGSSTTNRQLSQDTTAAIGLKYGSVDQQLVAAYAKSDAVTQQIPHWFDYYRAQVKGLQSEDAAARQGATDQITNLGGTMAAAAGRSAGADQSAMQADAAIRGATVDPAAVTRATQAAAVNTSGLADAAALQTTLGANQGSYWRGQQNVSEQAKIQALLGEQAYRRDNIDTHAAQIAREKGDYGTTYRSGRLSDERQNVLENQAFGLKSATADADAAAKAKAAKASASKYALDFAGKHGVSPAEYKAMSPSQRAASDRTFKSQSSPPKAPKGPSTIAKPPSGYTGSEADWNGMPRPDRDAWVQQHPRTTATSRKDAYGNTPRQVRAATDSFSRATTLGQILRAGGKKADGTAIPGATQTEIYQALISENINEVMARAVAQQLTQGFISPGLGRSLSRRGVKSGYTTRNPTSTAAGTHPRTRRGD
jgi:hypothetical protein